MEPQISARDPKTLAVIEKAQTYGLQCEIATSSGKEYEEVEIRLLDTERAKAGSIGEFVFSGMPGVAQVIRITPSAVSLATNGDYHTVRLGSTPIGRHHPTALIAGPCTVEEATIHHHAELLKKAGIRIMRGGCWKPRSHPGSYTGPGESGALAFLTAAKNTGMEAACIEVMDTSHISAVKRAKKASGFTGTVALWVGARTSNQELMIRLGQQKEFPIIVKNGLFETIDEFLDRVGFILSGDQSFDANGNLIPEMSLQQGNDQILLLWRGQKNQNRKSRYRNDPKLHAIGDLISRCWTPVGFDPSHAAGTMRDNLVIRLMQGALLLEDPDFIMMETKIDGTTPICDAEQAFPISDINKALGLLLTHKLFR